MTLDKFEHIKRQKWKSLFKENLIFVTRSYEKSVFYWK